MGKKAPKSKKRFDLYGERHGDKLPKKFLERIQRGDYNVIATEDPPEYGNDEALKKISEGDYSCESINNRWSLDSDKATRKALRAVLRFK